MTPFDSEADLQALADRFLDHSLPADLWRHDAHCLVTAWLLLRRPEIDLKAELPDLIRAYNVATGGQNTDSSGYHHTITLFYLDAISAFMAGPDTTDAAAACRAMLASDIGDKDYPLRFYSRDRLFSREARLGWCEPDLQVRAVHA
ncbi:hypothetical protein ABI_07520 [Asticcacaulis biprosthecium C19]|uniref:Uncharacterized protein n=1 Tax=Asticcacaulis biprosthecium C19 TaxID=715226 RepID=F4QLH2_9CAUL|nr:hypothetical protein [Asticcacaulis biprosthecium]EGF92317.1 hypothetical protein ABI_07520 [Asticcacaulis biprosthecium C19]